MKLPLPTTIVTGALGVGKTTAIAQLLARRPKGEKWAVLVNEFGALGIDGALLEAASGFDRPDDLEDGSLSLCMEDVVIRQLAGGCMCCVAAGMLTPALATLVRQAKPDRLLVEPSGLGHPAGILDILQGESLKSAIQVQAVICLVDPCQVSGLSGLYLDQVNISDIIVSTKADLASPESIAQFREWAAKLYPPKAGIHVVEKGKLDMSVLGVGRGELLPPTFDGLRSGPGHGHGQGHSHRCTGDDHGHEGSRKPPEPEAAGGVPAPGRPARFEASGDGGQAAGWVFAREDVFNGGALLDLLRCLWRRTARVKGVFRTGERTWVQPVLQPPDDGTAEGSDAGGRLELSEVAYRKDSRVEIILAAGGAGEGGAGRAAAAAPADGHAALESAVQGLSLGWPTAAEAIDAAVQACDWDAIERALLRLLK